MAQREQIPQPAANEVAPAPQINYNAPNRELSLVSYPDFLEGDQDPLTWLDEVEKAFATNLINDIDISLEKVFAQLATRKQQLNENVDAYYMPIQELLYHVEFRNQQYPETACAQIYLNGLRPEIVLAVAPSTPNTLQAAYERAKAYKCTCRQNLPYLTTSVNALYSSQLASSGLYSPVTTSDSYSVKDVPLFVIGSHDDSLPRNTIRRTKRRRENDGNLKSGEEETLEQLLQKENKLNKEKEAKVVESPSKIVLTKSKQASVKVLEDEMLQISSLFPLYSIITDLRDKMANITYGQLHQIVSSLQKDCLTKVRNLEEEDSEKRNEDSDNEYESEKLEDRIYNYSGVENETYLTVLENLQNL
ncbi:hypothetical protein C2G38_2225196 [Gigaspora rosea]|uniref:Uncharacterized protein n=1 Tax=Gigaspora rosea TaxID=44941 RepID=A0A397U2M0_9GLOM|nr:hypothetical protein C2G38_2225196 [Gigaspora rosea]